MNGTGKDSNDPADRELAERLRRLGEKLDSSRIGPKAEEVRTGAGADPSAMGKALRLSSEFIAGVVAGGLLGFAFDHFLGTSPLGLIVLLLLGFGAGIMNLMRSSGMLKTRSGSR